MTASGSSRILPSTYRDCLDFLFRRNQFSIKLGLDTINALLDRLGRPDAGMTFLHVAGTNGKGSVCANLASLLRACGYSRVGLYTSPHLVSFRERILVDGEPIPADWIVDWLRRAMDPVLELNATYFECVTALALDWFRARGCGAVVLETGLGGRLDATNAVRSALTVVTSISLDHTSILGGSVEEIWREKIAILKPGAPMVVQEDRPHLLAELRAKAEAAGSPVIGMGDHPWREAEGALQFHGRYATYTLPSPLRAEAHQRDNLALSLVAMETFLDGPLPPPGVLVPALEASRVPGRTQLLEAPGMLPVLLDGAHNPGGIAALETHLRLAYPGRRILAVFSMMRDKDFAAVYRCVAGFAAQVLFLSLEGKFPRALGYAELQAALEPGEREALRLFPAGASGLADILGKSGGNGFDLAVVCGSLYLLGEVIPRLMPHYPQLAWFRQFEGEA
ncbi:MAG TPA: cyanophycin synthetase [Fibrobacteria bacterium]|nr:cyanophycin synthetase [Fibrobacteria bacterium]